MAKFLDKTGLDTFWAKIKSTFQTLGNLVTAWGSTPSDTKYPSEKLVKDALDGKQATLAFDGTYNSSTNKAATVSTVTNAISGLDVSSVGGNGKYISAISETDGKISATATTMDTTPTANSTNAVTSGGIKTALDAKGPNAPSEVTIATGDKPLIADSSDSNKVKRASISFDTSVTNTLLRRDGTFAKALYADEGWGGTWGTALAPMDTYLLQQRNCFFGAKPSAVSVEYSTDGGSTWIDYGLNDEQKRNLFSQYGGTSVACGKHTHILPTYTGSIVGTKDLSNDNVANQRLRITICCRSLATEGTTTQTDKWLYATIRRVGIYMSTNSASKGPRHCVFTAKKREDFNAGNDTWINFGDYAISGDSGWNSIPCNNKATSTGITLGDSFSGQYAAFRFEVWSEGVNDSPAPSQTGNMIIIKIVAFSELCWINNSTNSNLANYGMPCAVNASTGSASFTKGITSGVAIPVSSGGTGATTAKGASYNINAGMNSGDSDAIADASRFVFNYVTPSATSGGLFYRTAPKVWDWIKGKISSVLGLSESNGVKTFTGNAATATKATQDSDGNAINATYFKSSGNTTLVAGAATKIGTQNGADVKLTLPAHQDISGKMNTSASNATAPSSSGGDGATATLLNNLTDGNGDIATTDDGDNVLIATTDNGGTVTNKWYKRKLVKLIPWIIKKLGTQLVYDCGTGSTSTTDFDNALAAFNAGKWVIIKKGSRVYHCVGSFSGPGLRFKQLADEVSLLKVNTLTWTRGSEPTEGTQFEAASASHTHSQYLTVSDINGKMETNGSNATSAAGGNIIRAMSQGVTISGYEDKEAVPSADIFSGGTAQRWYKFSTIWSWIKGKMTSDSGVNISGNAATSSKVAWTVGTSSTGRPVGFANSGNSSSYSQDSDFDGDIVYDKDFTYKPSGNGNSESALTVTNPKSSSGNEAAVITKADVAGSAVWLDSTATGGSHKRGLWAPASSVSGDSGKWILFNDYVNQSNNSGGWEFIGTSESAKELRIPYGSGSAYLQIGVDGDYLTLGTNRSEGVAVSYASNASTAAVGNLLAVANSAGTGVTSYYMRAIEYTSGSTTYIALTKNDGTSNVRVKSAENADGCDGWKFKVGSLGTATDTIYFIAGS